MCKLAATLIIAVITTPSYAWAPPPVAAQESKASPGVSADRLSPAEAKSIIAARAREVVRAIKFRDMQRLSSFVHPTKGLRFSQYGTVVRESDRVFRRNQVASLFKDNRRYQWGEYDGSGDPIRLSAREYFKKFLYQQDMLRAREISYNTNSAGGNTIPNFFDSYPQAIIVIYHHPGSDPRFDGMDWQQLWMAFERKGQTWYLVGIASHEWTI